MGKGGKIKKPHETKSVITQYLDRTSSVAELETDDCFVVSFKHFDKKQGLGIYEWEKQGLLANAINVLANYCQQPLLSQCDGKKFTIYGGFPERSNYTHPVQVPQDANWARIHIDGIHIIAGHILRNIFYVVFLDHDHGFSISEKKNT